MFNAIVYNILKVSECSNLKGYLSDDMPLLTEPAMFLWCPGAAWKDALRHADTRGHQPDIFIANMKARQLVKLKASKTETLSLLLPLASAACLRARCIKFFFFYLILCNKRL